jgi:DNA-binding response OmpR family regulator
VLLVEDDPATARALRSILARRGWSVQVASTVAEASPLLDPAPAWLLLDLMLPDGDGTVILRRVREERLCTRVIITTGSSDRERLREVRALLPDLLLSKPIKLDQLFETLGEPV